MPKIDSLEGDVVFARTMLALKTGVPIPNEDLDFSVHFLESVIPYFQVGFDERYSLFTGDMLRILETLTKMRSFREA